MWDLLKFSHRVVGPLVPFQRAIERLTAGEQVAEVRLRHGDLLSNLQSTFNQYLTSLRTMESSPRLMDSDAELKVPAETAPVPTFVAELIERQLADELRQMDQEYQTACAHGDQPMHSCSSAEQMIS